MSNVEVAVIDGVETTLYYDPPLGTWHFQAPGITGGGQKTLEDARAAAAEAIAFSRE